MESDCSYFSRRVQYVQTMLIDTDVDFFGEISFRLVLGVTTSVKNFHNRIERFTLIGYIVVPYVGQVATCFKKRTFASSSLTSRMLPDAV